MKLTSLQIERFGTRSNLQLEGLSDQLNVIYGPNGSGKTTIINFIRWMLYGSVDDASRRFLLGAESRLGGTLRLIDGHQHRRRVERYYDATRGDQVRVTHDEPNGAHAIDPQRLTGVDLNEYGHIFCFGFDQPPSLERLIDVTRARDLAVAHDQTQKQRLSELTARLDDLRRDYPQLGRRGDAGGAARAAAAVAERFAAGRTSLRRAAAGVAAGMRRAGKPISRRTAATWKVCRPCCDGPKRPLSRGGGGWNTWRARRIRRVPDGWNNGGRKLRKLTTRFSSGTACSNPSASGRRVCRLSCLTANRRRPYRLPRTKPICDCFCDRSAIKSTKSSRTIAKGKRPTTRSRHAVTREYLRQVLGAALQSTHDDVHRLCRELQRQQANAHYHDRARELDHLRRCEGELNSLVDSLNQRRQALLVDARIQRPALGRSASRSWTTLGQRHLDHPTVVRRRVDQRQRARPAPFRSSPSDPVLEASLSHLIRRRDHLVTRINELESRLGQLGLRLAHLQSSQQHVDEARELDTLRRALEELDGRIVGAERSQRRRDEIASLERQIDELRRNLGPSDILREASSLLHRLTEGAYRVLRINDRHETRVEDSQGHSLEYRELSRGTRDQVYLSLALAIVAAYRRRGVELPMVLNDVFVNIDTERAQATAELLAHFASRGHQIILCTRHEHVIQRFSALPAKLYTLRQRYRVDEPPRPAINPPRADAYYLDQAPLAPPHDAGKRRRRIRVPEPPRREQPYDWVAHWDPPRRPATMRVEQDAVSEGAASGDHRRLPSGRCGMAQSTAPRTTAERGNSQRRAILGTGPRGWPAALGGCFGPRRDVLSLAVAPIAAVLRRSVGQRCGPARGLWRG